MSSVAFGALATRREESPSGTSKSGQPPGLNSYIDILTALVPAEVLAIQALVIAEVKITEPTTLRWTFWLLIGLSIALFVLGRRPVRTPAVVREQSGGAVSRWQRWEWQDWLRLLIPPAAFAGWSMLEPVSAWDAVAPHMPAGLRLLVPLVGASFLAAAAKALAAHADKKAPPPQVRELSALAQAAQRGMAEKARLSGELMRAQQAEQEAVKSAELAEPKPVHPEAGPGDAAVLPAEDQQPGPDSGTFPEEPPSMPGGGAAGDEQVAPKWVY